MNRQPTSNQVKALRKDFRNLTPSQEQQYFFLLRLLYLLPAPQGDAKDTLQYQNPNKIKQYDPQTMYDCLVKFHSRSCEHRSQFFIYWHRWLMLKFQKYLLRAHTLILDKQFVSQSTEHLLKIMNIGNNQNKKKQIEDLLKNAQEAYKKIENLNTQYIAAHYWDCFDFSTQIKYPNGFVKNQQKYADKFKQLDKLISLVWQQDSIFTLNYKKRFNWIGVDQYFFNQIPFKDQNDYLYKQDDIEKLISDVNFWKNPTKQSPSYKIADKFLVTPNLQNYQIYFHNRSAKRRRQSKKIHQMLLNPFEQIDINYLFFGKKYSYYEDENENDSTSTNSVKKVRNARCPIIQYAKTLKIPGDMFERQFLQGKSNSGIQNVHNIMHNIQGYLMTDGYYSIVNPIFFAYHSFIDLLLQFRIKQFYNPTSIFNKMGKSDVENAYIELSNFLKSQLDENNTSFRYQIKKLLKKKKNDEINSNYPLVKWIVAQSKSLQNLEDYHYAVAQYTYKQLMLHKEERLNQLKDIENVDYDITSNFRKNIQKAFRFVNNNIQFSAIPKQTRNQNTSENNSGLIQSPIMNLNPNLIQGTTQPQLINPLSTGINLLAGAIKNMFGSQQSKFKIPTQTIKSPSQSKQAQVYKKKIAAILSYKSTIPSQQVAIQLINKNNKQQLIDLEFMSIFSRAQQAQKCPNCPEFNIFMVMFQSQDKLKLVQAQMKKFENTQQSTGGTNKTYQYVSQANNKILNSYFLNISNKNNIKGKFLIGRQSVKVNFTPVNKKQTIQIVLHTQQFCSKQGQLLKYSKKRYYHQVSSQRSQIIFKGQRKFIIIALQVKSKYIYKCQFQGYKFFSEINLQLETQGQKQSSISFKFNTKFVGQVPFMGLLAQVQKALNKNNLPKSLEEIANLIFNTQLKVSISIQNLKEEKQNTIKETKSKNQK